MPIKIAYFHTPSNYRRFIVNIKRSVSIGRVLYENKSYFTLFGDDFELEEKFYKFFNTFLLFFNPINNSIKIKIRNGKGFVNKFIQ